MKKFWVLLVLNRAFKPSCRANEGGVGVAGTFATKEEAVDEMKRKAGADKSANYHYAVAEAVLTVKVPVPEVDIVELKA